MSESQHSMEDKFGGNTLMFLDDDLLAQILDR